MSGRPNILVIMTDQLSARFLPFYGNKVAKTPHLSRLAERSVVFNSAYCASPLCAPSRFAMMTGQLPSKIGAYDNAANFPADIPTYAHYLRNAGYRTTLSGKMHFVGPDQLHGFEERLTTDIYPADFGWTPDWENDSGKPEWYYGDPTFLMAGPCQRSNSIDFDEETVFAARRHLFDIARSDDKRPFCLVVSMTHPHEPYYISQEYWDRYSDEDIDLPVARTTPDPNDSHWHRMRTQVLAINEGHDESDDTIRRARRAYYGAISFVDDQIGILLNALDNAGFGENTLIVFTSDHGDMLGERGLWDKGVWYENAARIPLLISLPKQFQPHAVDSAVSLIDLLPTFAEIAGAGVPPQYAAPIDGRSLLPHLNGYDGHDEAFGEFLGEGTPAPILMIRRGRYKYIRSMDDPEQLFDLRADPNELSNLALTPELSHVTESFRSFASSKWDERDIKEKVIASQRRRNLLRSALGKGQRTSWDFQPKGDASQQYIRNQSTHMGNVEERKRLAR